MSLDTKSIHELRQIAQNMGIPDVFSTDQAHLLQEIRLRETPTRTTPVKIERNYKDHRLLIDKPAEIVDPTDILDVLRPYTVRGLHVRFDDEYWFVTFGKKEDSGTIRMPLRDIVACVERLLA